MSSGTVAVVRGGDRPEVRRLLELRDPAGPEARRMPPAGEGRAHDPPR